jgi:glycosidase
MKTTTPRCVIAATAALAASLVTGCAKLITPAPPWDLIVSEEGWANNAVLYQVNTRQHTEAGTFDAVRERLDEIASLGVTMLWFKPIHPIGEVKRKGTLGSPYAATDYKAINPEHGTADDLRELVEAAHERRIAVILDFVANHTAWDHEWTVSNPDWYAKGKGGGFTPPNDDWSDVIQLDHDSEAMQDAMAEAMVWWVEEFDIDGFRLDVAGLVPMQFWERVHAELNEIKPVFMLAEASGPEFHTVAFDATYAWYFGSMAERVARGEATARELAAAITEDGRRYPDRAIRMHFTSNHDWNSWNGTVWERYGDAADLFAAMTFVLNGMPLIYNGQEAGLDRRLDFFEKDPIEWRDHPKRELYTTLAHLKRRNPTLHHGGAGGDQRFLPVADDATTLVLVRSATKGWSGRDVMMIANLSDAPATVSFTAESAAGRYVDAMTGDEHAIESVHRENLGPWGWRILTKLGDL